MEVGLIQLGELLGGLQYAQRWFTDWTSGYFNRDSVQPPGTPSTAGTPVVSVTHTGETSSSASTPNIVKNTEDLDAELEVSTGHVGLAGRTRVWSPCRLLQPHGWGRLRFGKLCPSRWVDHLLTRLPYPGQSWVTVLTNLTCRGWELRLPFRLLYPFACLSSQEGHRTTPVL